MMFYDETLLLGLHAVVDTDEKEEEEEDIGRSHI